MSETAVPPRSGLLPRVRRYLGPRRWLKTVRRELDRAFVAFDRADLDRALARVGLEPGVTVCVHSAMSRLGYFSGGPRDLIDAIAAAVGPAGSIMMPTYPMRGSMKTYLDGGEVFDVRLTPARIGRIPETFRSMPGVRRSLHPTNPVAVLGPAAEDLIRGHGASPTPYGHGTPFGRLAARSDAFILMLGTPVLSLGHHLQERVDFPNLFLPGDREARVIDDAGAVRTIRTRVLRPRIPYFVALPPAAGPSPDWALMHDFMLVFPAARRPELERRGHRFDGYPTLWQRRARFESQGLLRTTRLGRSEVGLLHVGGFLAAVEPELRELIDRFRSWYDPERIARLGLEYF